MCLIERRTSTKGAMRAGRKVVQGHIINISSEKTGIGKLIHPIKITEPITGKLQEQVRVIHYRIIIRFWVWTGEGVKDT